uniref:23S rRNA pseudouridine2605 synthase n=1 Tax=Candidatus Kentrum sp. LFY TaxID=2126342 RepID=A0A450U637_9GAMM|nr:MAG: 23S rRNA pseudouridine2605 synthase [Candidatus Kentron sp. LFY]
MDKTPKRPFPKPNPARRKNNRTKKITSTISQHQSEKLQKVLAEAGLGSRRSLEHWIASGRVDVNGVPATLGARVQESDTIRVDGRKLFRPSPGTARLRVLRYHKPVGEICSRADPEDRPSVFQRLPGISRGRWIAVGRLDINTCGLLLFTNAGELANRLMHPSSGTEREYAVRVLPWSPEKDSAQSSSDESSAGIKYDPNGKKNGIAPDVIERLRKGVRLEDGVARFEDITDAGGQGQNHWYHVTIREGKTHEVRRLWEAVGLRVSRLIRIRYGPIRLERNLRPGRWEELSAWETAQLARSVGLGRLIGTPKLPPRKPRYGESGKPRKAFRKPPEDRSGSRLPPRGSNPTTRS